MMDGELIVDNSLALEQVSNNYNQEFFSLCQAINLNGMKYLPDIVENCTDTQKTKEWLDDYYSKFRSTGAPDYFIKFHQKIVGIIGFHPWDKESEVGEMAIWISPDYHRKGIAFRCLDFLVPYSFKEFKLEKIEFIVEDENINSINLAKKYGFAKGENRVEESRKGLVSYKYFYLFRSFQLSRSSSTQK